MILCHQWGKLKDFAGTIETINGGWVNGESPMSHPPSTRQQNRVNAFLRISVAIGLDPHADGWNGLSISDSSPCERYLPSTAYCFEKTPPGTCATAALPPVPTSRGVFNHTVMS